MRPFGRSGNPKPQLQPQLAADPRTGSSFHQPDGTPLGVTPYCKGRPSLLTLRTLGSLDLLDSDGDEITVVLSQPKRLALLVYLACAHPRRLHRRDSLLALFWPERDNANARNSLSQGLSFLRSHLPADLILGRGAEEVGLAEGLILTDTDAFRAAIAEQRWAEALELYRGEFLPGFHVGDAWAFGEWVEAERERLRELAAGAAWALAREQIQRGVLMEAERTAQRAFGLVWSDETPVREFMRNMAAAGDRVAALNFFERFCQKIRAELDVEPSPETRELADAIRNGDLVTTPLTPVVSTSVGPPSAEPVTAAASPGSPEGQGSGPWKLWFWSLAFAAVACFAAVGILRLRWASMASRPPPDDRPFTVLADVQGTASPEIREAVAFLLRSGLDMAHVVQTVPLLDVERTLSLLDRNPDSAIDPALAREVAARLGVRTVVLPRLDRLGEEYILGMRVEDVDEGWLRAEVRGVARGETGIVEMVDQVTRQTRGRLGEAGSSLVANQPLPEVLTASLEALREYQLARQYGAGQAQLAVAHLRKAVALDTAFATAWQLMASFYGNYLNEPDSAELARQQSDRFSHRLSAARRSDLELHRRMREDVAFWDVALAEAEEAVRRDPRYLNNYGVYTAVPGGLPDSALNIRFRLEREGAEVARRFSPDLPYATRCFINTHYLAAALDRMHEWYALLDSLDIQLPQDCDREATLFELLAAGEWSRADSLVQNSPGEWRWPTAVEVSLLQTVPLRGRVREAYRTPILARPETRALRPDSSGLSNISHLLLQLAYGLPLEDGPEESFIARGKPQELMGRGRYAVTDYVLYGVRESLLGDTSEARRVTQRLRAMRDSATSNTFEGAFRPWFTLLEIGPAYQRGDWPSVVQALEPLADRIHEPGIGAMGGDDYIIWWLLADSYVQLDDPASGIPHLESILERPRRREENWILQGFIHPAARFRLAGLYVETGEVEKAREQYRLFLDTFTDPDPEVQWMVEEARSRLDSLGG